MRLLKSYKTSYFDGVLLPKQKAFNQENIQKMRLVNDGSFQQTAQVDDSILSELHQNFGLNIGQDDQLDAVCEKDVEEEDMVDANASQVENRTKKTMGTPSTKVAHVPQCPI